MRNKGRRYAVQLPYALSDKIEHLEVFTGTAEGLRLRRLLIEQLLLRGLELWRGGRSLPAIPWGSNRGSETLTLPQELGRDLERSVGRGSLSTFIASLLTLAVETDWRWEGNFSCEETSECALVFRRGANAAWDAAVGEIKFAEEPRRVRELDVSQARVMTAEEREARRLRDEAIANEVVDE